EARDPDVLTRLRGELGTQLLDRLALVASRANVLLLQQCHLLGPLRELAVDDLVDHLRGLALLARRGLEQRSLGVPNLVRDLLRRDIDRRRARARDVDRDLAGELLKLVAAGHEVGLA